MSKILDATFFQTSARMLHLTVTLYHIFSTLLLCTAVMKADGECPPVCSCAASSRACPAGVSWVSDHCGCCKICARQFNEDCSATEPCDHIKGLRCHPGAGGDPERGLCRAEEFGLPCEFNGQLYQHSENFQPSCQHQCTCINGVVGCMPLCPHQVPLPDWQCLWQRLVTSEDSCCGEWVCDDDNRIREEPEGLSPIPLSNGLHLPNHISASLPLKPRPRQPATGGAVFRDLFPTSDVLLESGCFPQTTEWTECSASCGMGLSSRVTNDNPDCQLIRETRLCQIRQCDQELLLTIWGKQGKKCQRTVWPQEPVKMTFAGCSTIRRYRPRTCGFCTDGRCCRPSVSRTVRLRFLCPDGESFYRNVMWIQRCSCTKSCRAHSRPSGPSLSLHNDIHTFRH